jgi:L-threonylcarbamoyladenylate synthase
MGRISRYLTIRYAEDVKIAVGIVKSGGVIAYPTETVYGVGALALQEPTVKKVIALKRMGPKPISLAVSNFKMIKEVAFVDDFDILKDLLPGPITVILRKREVVPDILTSGSHFVGVRYPSHKIARLLIAKVGAPITSTSANITSFEAPMSAQDVTLSVDYVLDGGPSVLGPSTVVDLVNKMIVRRGAGYERIVEKTGIL